MAKRLCLDCNRLTVDTRCTPCRLAHQAKRDARRGTTTQRGLGWPHQRARQQLVDQAGPITHCPRCGRAITKANPISGEHSTARAHGGTETDGLICRSCNSSAGARIRRSDVF